MTEFTLDRGNPGIMELDVGHEVELSCEVRLYVECYK